VWLLGGAAGGARRKRLTWATIVHHGTSHIVLAIVWHIATLYGGDNGLVVDSQTGTISGLRRGRLDSSEVVPCLRFHALTFRKE